MRHKNRLFENLMEKFQKESKDDFIKKYELTDGEYYVLSKEIDAIVEKYYDEISHENLMKHFDKKFFDFFNSKIKNK